MEPTPRPPRRWLPWLLLAALGGGALGAGGAAAWLASPAGGYLALQAASDAVHRAVVLGVPLSAVALVLTWTLGELGRYLRWPRRLGRALAALGLAGLCGLPAFALVYDRGLEARGLAGALFLPPEPPGPASGPERGTYREEGAAAPGLASAPFADGSYLTLERRSLARKRPDGSFAWSRARPGPPPASLSLAGGQLAYTGPGPDFPDDVLLELCDPDSGRLALRLHVLGAWASPAVLDGQAWVFTASRPATCEVHRVEPGAPGARWARRLPGPCAPPSPRPAGDALEIAAGGGLWRLARADGAVLSREAACEAPARWRVACRDGQVVAWVPPSEERQP